LSDNFGCDRAAELLRKLRIYSQKKGVEIPYAANTPYVNTISLEY
jgi:pyruvate dehydrogenase E1 component